MKHDPRTRRLLAREKRLAKLEKAKARAAKRRAKRAAKAAPRKALADWAHRVKCRDHHRCAICRARQPKTVATTVKRGKNKGKPITRAPWQLNAHHILPKEYYHEYKYKRVCGISLCPQHHKYARHSAHRNPVWFTLWLKTNRPKQYKWAVRHMGGPTDPVKAKQKRR